MWPHFWSSITLFIVTPFWGAPLLNDMVKKQWHIFQVCTQTCLKWLPVKLWLTCPLFLIVFDLVTFYSFINIGITLKMSYHHHLHRGCTITIFSIPPPPPTHQLVFGQMIKFSVIPKIVYLFCLFKSEVGVCNFMNTLYIYLHCVNNSWTCNSVT